MMHFIVSNWEFIAGILGVTMFISWLTGSVD